MLDSIEKKIDLSLRGVCVEFWSSVEYQSFQWALIRALRPEYARVVQKFVVSACRYRRRNGVSGRMLFRFLAYGLYAVKIALDIRFGVSPRVAIVSSNTFYAPYIAMKFAAKGVAVVNWILDLYPDALFVTSDLRASGFAAKRIEGLMLQSFREADANVFIGKRLLMHAEARFGPIPRAAVIPVGADDLDFDPKWDDIGNEVVVLYSGNFGLMHDFEALLGFFVEQSGVMYDELGRFSRNIRFVFSGEGAGIAALQGALAGLKLRPDLKVEFRRNLSDADWRVMMMQAHIGLVTMKRGAEAVLFPSKAYSAMAAGQAIIAICSRSSDLSDAVLENRCGWVVDPGDSVGLGRLLYCISNDSEPVNEYRQRSRKAAQTRYSQTVIANQWSAVIRDAMVRLNAKAAHGPGIG